MKIDHMAREMKRLACLYIGMMVSLFIGVVLYLHIHSKNLDAIKDSLIIRISAYKELLDTLGILFFVFIPIMIVMFGIGARKMIAVAKYIRLLSPPSAGSGEIQG